MARRFIAGAVCPKCQTLDRIVVEALPDEASRAGSDEPGLDGSAAGDHDAVLQRRCVSCGFTEIQQSDRESNTATRVPRGRAERRKNPVAQVEPVRILDPMSGSAGDSGLAGKATTAPTPDESDGTD